MPPSLDRASSTRTATPRTTATPVINQKVRVRWSDVIDDTGSIGGVFRQSFLGMRDQSARIAPPGPALPWAGMSATIASTNGCETNDPLGGPAPRAAITQHCQPGKRPRRQGANVSRSETCASTEGCKRCRANPRSPCVACTQRRRRATQLHEQDGQSAEQIATTMRLSVPRVERLLEEEAQYRDLQRFICDAIPVETLQALIRQREREDPTLTHAKIAREAGYARTLSLLRAVGLEPTAKALRRGREYPPELRTHIDIGVASRIVRALGFAPHEVPNL
jgi:hypothetical protein